ILSHYSGINTPSLEAVSRERTPVLRDGCPLEELAGECSGPTDPTDPRNGVVASIVSLSKRNEIPLKDATQCRHSSLGNHSLFSPTKFSVRIIFIAILQT
ncbi:unnamed protein product, partial [Nezara viridula]